MGGAFLDAVAALPPGSGVVFRHYSLAERERKALFRIAHRILQQTGGGQIYLADTVMKSIRWGADGVHLTARASKAFFDARQARQRGLGVTQSVHDCAELARANRSGATAMISPVYPTRSHPDGAVLGEEGFAELAQHARVPVIALGGMTPTRFARLAAIGAYGWAAIDALMPDSAGQAGQEML